MIARLQHWVAGLHATIRTKLLGALLLITVMLAGAASVGVYALSEMQVRAMETVRLQRKIAAYRQLNHDIVAQLHGVATALLVPQEVRLEATLRQLRQFGYDLDRLGFIANDEREIIASVRAGFDQFRSLVARTVQMVREGRRTEGVDLQLREAGPLAERLERLTNELVNKAEAELVSGIAAADQAYARSRMTVLASAAVSVMLSLALGYAISWSLIAPIRQMESRLRQIAAGDFSHKLQVPNRDELGSLANSVDRMSERLGVLYAQVEAAREHAVRESVAKSNFLAAASHDLRQPLHALNLWVNNLQVALASGDHSAARSAAQIIEESCRSMSASFNAILDLHKLEAHAVRPDYTNVDIGQLLAQVHREFEPTAREKGIDLRLRTGGLRELYARSDSVMLVRAIRNLVSNAVKFTHRGGVLLAQVAHVDTIEIAVVDTGTGIPEQHREDIFREFFQVARESSDAAQGMGLGLAIVERSMRVLDGHRIDCATREGRGSRFSIHAPRVRQLCPGPGSLEGSATQGRIPGAYLVVVDDDPSVLRGLTQLLTNWGCAVEAGPSGDVVLDLVLRNERLPDLLITDLHLAHGESGLEVVRSLHKALQRAIPVVVFTADRTARLDPNEMEAPVKLLHKPVTPEKLRGVMEQLLPLRRFV